MSVLYKRSETYISWLILRPERLEILYTEEGGVSPDNYLYVSTHDWAEDISDRMAKAQNYHLHYLIDRIFNAKRIVRE